MLPFQPTMCINHSGTNPDRLLGVSQNQNILLEQSNYYKLL